MARVIRMALFVLIVGTLEIAAQPKAAPVKGGTVAFKGRIQSMDPANNTYGVIQIVDGVITELAASGNPPEPVITVNAPAVIYPGFIDTHSHAISYLLAQSTGADGSPNWISLANVNVMDLEPCPDPVPTGSTTCFAPVTTQADVERLIGQASKNSAGWILGWNYEPSRMTCENGSKYGFACPNFANMKPGDVLNTLDRLQPTVPVLITSESGHIFYVNRAAMKELNICTLDSDDPKCHEPVVNPNEEMRLAMIAGQLDEDLALYAIGYVEGKLGEAYARAFVDPLKDPTAFAERLIEFNSKQIIAAVEKYSSLGYTTVQEGAASEGLIGIYMKTADALAKSDRPLPATIAFLEYDETSACNFASSVRKARKSRNDLIAGGYDMFMAGMKAYADGTNQGYTGDMGPTVPYKKTPSVFTDSGIFPKQPYQGLPDYDGVALQNVTEQAHDAGFPMWVHTNGRRAQKNVIDALAARKHLGLRDVIVHFAMPLESDVKAAADAGLGATFLINDFYFFYHAVCEQILGSEATRNFYPAAWAQKYQMPFGIHSDVSVTPPDPLLGMRIAVDRVVEQPEWLPPLSGDCAFTGTNPPQQKISRDLAMRAYTVDAAWLYGRENRIGSLQKGYAGDLVVLSEDPRLPTTDLSKVKVLYTVHNGRVVYAATDPGTKSGTKAARPRKSKSKR